MKYLFEELELTINIMKFSGLGSLDSKPDFNKGLFARIAAVKKNVSEIFLQTTDDSLLEKFFVLHHSSLVRMLEDLLQLIKSTMGNYGDQSDDTEAKQRLLVLYHQLSDLFEFFQKHFKKYIPGHEVFPKLFRKPYVAEVQIYAKDLEQHLPLEIDKRLRSFILEPFLDFVESKACTWHQLSYCRLLYQEFKKLMREDLFPSSTEFIWMLYSMNVNSVSFYEYFTEYIRESHKENALLDLYYFRKKCRQAYVKPDVAYLPEERSLSEMVFKWLKEEINFLEKAQEHTASEPVKGSAQKPSIEPKILTHLSVAELAYLKRVMSETNIFAVRNKKEFCEVLAKSFRTDNMESISSESLRSKWYGGETAVKSSVKSRLIGMLNYIKRDS